MTDEIDLTGAEVVEVVTEVDDDGLHWDGLVLRAWDGSLWRVEAWADAAGTIPGILAYAPESDI